MLGEASKKRLDAALRTRKERCILVADKESNLIRKVVEMGDILVMLTLVGDGNREMHSSIPVGDNLLAMSLPCPMRISLSITGRLAILYDEGRRILILNPASKSYIYHTAPYFIS